jgi:hypothetical protein
LRSKLNPLQDAQPQISTKTPIAIAMCIMIVEILKVVCLASVQVRSRSSMLAVSPMNSYP